VARGDPPRGHPGRLTVALARITLALLAANVRAQLQYRADFLVWVAVGMAFQLTGFFFLWALLTRFDSVGGWTLEEIAFLYGLRLLAHALTVFSLGGLQIIEWLVREGWFDQYLVRPLPPMLSVLTWWRPSSLGDLAGGVALLAVATRVAPIDLSPLAAAYLVLAILGAVLIEGGIRLGIAALSFRFVRVFGVLWFVDSLFNNFGNLPLRIFGGVVEFVLTFIIPVAFVAYLPASVLLGRTAELSVRPEVAYLAPAAGLIVLALGYLVWRHELPRYQSTGT
jgi:ABC-2 type transport system permease protein